MTKTLRNLHFAALCSAALIPTTQAETIWADGVSATSGWYDANKTHEDDGKEQWNGDMYYPNDPSGPGAMTDDNMCYAAAAANLLAWWQGLYQKTESIPSGVDSLSGKYDLNDTDIWSTFVKNSRKNSGLNVPYAINWFMTGDDLSFNAYLNKTEGYYSTTVPSGITLYDKNDTTGSYFIQKHAGTAANIIDILSSGRAAALELGGHSITLWGATVEGSTITSLFITDSDDYTGTTDLMEVELTTGADGKLTFRFNESDTKTRTIESIYTINPEISDSWGMERLPSSDGDTSVPEPTTATLSLMALAALAARRRRH